MSDVGHLHKDNQVVADTSPSPFKTPNLWVRIYIHTYGGGVALAGGEKKLLN